MRVVVAGQGWIAVRAARLLAGLVVAKDLDAHIEVARNRGDTGEDTWLPSGRVRRGSRLAGARTGGTGRSRCR